MCRCEWLLVGEEGFIEHKASSRQRRREEKKEKTLTQQKDSFKSFVDTSDIDIMKVSVM